ncbi:MAG: aromatic amino acid lyase, partial [Candidatus Binataceae bacterium]
MPPLRGGLRFLSEGERVPATDRTVVLDGARLSLEDLEAIAFGRAAVVVSEEARARVIAARACVAGALERGEAVYGVTTGFGRMANVAIAPADSAALQLNL